MKVRRPNEHKISKWIDAPPLAPHDAAASLGSARLRLMLVAFVFAIGFVVGVPLLAESLGPWAAVVYLGASLGVAGLWTQRIWVCPRCHHTLGRSLTPSRCVHCEQPFQT